MDSTREYLEQQQNRAGGIAGDLKQLKNEGGTTAAELREFLSKLKGRSPEEVMGVVANSDLVRSTLTASIGCFVLLIVLTIIPYALQQRSANVTEKPAAATASQPVNEAPVATAEPEPQASEQAAAAVAPDFERAAEAMGIGGASDADPQTNPLDSKLDDLLDGIE